MSFNGFPQAGLDFLADLAQNNNKAWFEANKSTYKKELLEPAILFIETIGEQLKLSNPAIRYDMRTNGSGSLMRIYRDTRFSKDKTPYKTNISGMWWQGEGKKTQHPAFGFQLEPTGMKLMAGMFGFDKAQLAAYREAVLDDSLGSDLSAIVASLEKTMDYAFVNEHYKRVPRGLDPEHPRQRLLRFKGLYAYPKKDLALSIVKSNKLTDTVLTHFQTIEPLQQWLVKALFNG